MNGIKEAIEYLIKDVSGVNIEEIDGRTYSDKHLVRIDEPKIETLSLSTLSSVVDVIKKKIVDPKHIIIQIQSPTDVTIRTNYLNDVNQREIYVKCIPDLPTVTTDRFMDLESFNIMLQSVFVDSEDLRKVLAVVGSVTDNTVKTIDDDGITQQVQVKAGITRKADAVVPNPVRLYPFRTFVEINQPSSNFVLRMKDGPSAALFEADGGAWRLEAVQRIKEYLTSELKELEVLIIA